MIDAVMRLLQGSLTFAGISLAELGIGFGLHWIGDNHRYP